MKAIGAAMETLDHLVARAVAAQAGGMPGQAADLWRTVRERDPRHELGWATECALLLQLGRPDQAETTILAASQARLMFNLSPRNTWAELIRMPVEDIDDHVLDTMLLRHKSGVSVLPAPRVQNCRDPLDGARVRQLLSLLRARFHCIVLDTPHDLQQGTVTALDESDKILSVMVPELASLAGANAALEVFQTMNYPANRVHVVLNRIHERHQVDQRQIETTLKRPVDVIIPYAGYAATEAINLGEPVTLSSPESAVSTAVEDLAFCLSKKDHPEEPPADPSHAWQRATRRWGRKDHKGFRRLFGWRSPASSEPQPGN